MALALKPWFPIKGMGANISDSNKMGIRIHQLPPLIANQIAAGEVIERPSSVVKELLENALDAEANSITIEIEYGGLNRIKMSDDGKGILAEDLPLAVAAHATSKIATLNDLYAIESMGFRGEALASIASVAKVTISSRPQEQDTAMMLQVCGAEVVSSPCARTVGTTIEVADLFFNAPVRKRFLKSEKLEFQSIELVVKRFALSAPQIAINLKHNGKQVLSLPSARSEEAQLTRLRRLLGTVFVKEAVFLDVERSAMRLYGWVSGKTVQRSQNDRLWVYVNQRMVKDKLLNHAIKQAYEDLLYPGRFPACVLYFTINHAEVDVNIHPTKYEVRFQQPRLVHDFFTSQLTAVLRIKQEQKEEIICETPHQVHETSMHYPLLRTKSPPEPRDKAISWVILNPQYILAFIEQQPYVVDLFALNQDYVYEQVSQQTKPLANRPLLVPIRGTLSKFLTEHFTELSANLADLGVQLEFIEDCEVWVRSIPLILPYLNISGLFEALNNLSVFDLDRLAELMCQNQVFDSKFLSLEEKIELNKFLVENQEIKNKKSVFKALTWDECRNLLDA
jgi:DNA mismatch repair protein MutL